MNGAFVKVGNRTVWKRCPVSRAAGDGGPDRTEHYFRPFAWLDARFVCAFCLLSLTEAEARDFSAAVSV